MADDKRWSATDDRTSGTNQERGDLVDASRATQGASPPPRDATGGQQQQQQGDGVQDTPEITEDQPDGDRAGAGGYGDSSGFAEGTRGSRDS